MEFLLDSHTHSLASGHAYSTTLELAAAAARRGLKLLCVTDHGPGMISTTTREYFFNFGVIDREIEGVEILMGAELNVMDLEGTLDLDGRLLDCLDMAIASLHPPRIPPCPDAQANTHALIQAMDCPKVCILGHPDDGRYPLDYPTLVRAAGERGVLLEVNNTSLTPGCFRKDGPLHCAQMLRECRRQGVSVVVGSDAHFASAVGAHQYAQALLEELDFPPELVLNTHPARFKQVIEKKIGAQ